MKPGHHIKYMDIIRFRNGTSALMKVHKLDTLCGYVTYHGVHLYGETISVSGPQCRPATVDEIKLWNEYSGVRRAYAINIGRERDLEWAS